MSTGVRRSVAASATRRASITTALDGRTVLTISITSPGAKQIRVHFRDFDAGAGEVWVYASGDDLASPPFRGKGTFDDGEFWSGVVNSETAMVSYVAPAGEAASGELPFAIDAVAHKWLQAGPNADDASGCNLDVSCYSSYVGYATAVARYEFVADDGYSYDCSGAMINTVYSSFRPYFLTAHHCITNNTEARTMFVEFLYQTSVCNGIPPSIFSLPSVYGGTYLAGADIPHGDYAFILLSSVPAGVQFLGWNASLSQGAFVAGIHHPQYSHARISFGARGADQSISVSGDDGVHIAPASLYYQVTWSSGVTEGGSSGSPLINSSGQILGTLTAGTPVGYYCPYNPSSTYGRFGNVYNAVSSYLNDAPPNSLTAIPNNLSFQVTNGVVTSVPQTVLVLSQPAASIAFSLQSNRPWLHASFSPAVTPVSVSITVDPATVSTPGTYTGTITASSSSATSVPIDVTVTTTTRPSNVVVTVSPNPVYKQNTDSSGYSWFYTITCTETGGAATQLTGLKIRGLDLSSQIATFFGATTLGAYGTLVAQVRDAVGSVPATQTVEVDGVDFYSNRSWQAPTQVLFLGTGLRFVPVTPCRIADTRGAPGGYGGPSLGAGIARDFDIRNSACGIPATAQAYSLNLTVVPIGSLGFLSVWPAGQGQPTVSTLNSGDGRTKANAAIVPAGVNGAVTLFASNAAHAIIDINGYFVPITGNNNLAFYPLTPCRIADTRAGSGTFGGPALAAGVTRSFPLLSSVCGIPATAQAYALNMTVVPQGGLGFLSAWPAGLGQPGSSTLNAPTGAVTANAAIVPAGVGGAIWVIATNQTDLIIDINGYFAPPLAGGMNFYTASPCRIADTRVGTGDFGGPPLAGSAPRSFVVPASACNIPAAARAYSLNATVVPPAGLSFLSLWGGGAQPLVSTLNAGDGSVVANAALVPASGTGSVSAVASNATHLILDINGYFVP